MNSYQRHYDRNNDADWSLFTPFYLAGRKLGMLHRDVAACLLQTPHIGKSENGFTLTDAGGTPESRSAVLKNILHYLIAEKVVSKERFELYSVAETFEDPPLALADRALMPLMGFRAYGIHCNAFVRDRGEIKLWSARRALTASVDPGKLDHLVAGGQPYGLTLRENLAKEAHEEAGIPPELVAPATAHGSISYARHNWQGRRINGVRRDTLYMFDLELPLDFTPRSMDGESHDFRLLTIPEIMAKLETDEFKFNVPLVIIDFLRRRGFLPAQSC